MLVVHAEATIIPSHAFAKRIDRRSCPAGENNLLVWHGLPVTLAQAGLQPLALPPRAVADRGGFL